MKNCHSPRSDLTAELDRLREVHLYRAPRVLEGPQGPRVSADGRQLLAFCSNDYLGLANHPQVIAALKRGADTYGVGSGAAHLVTGHSTAHQALEEELADFTGRPRALLFSTGYMANLGVISALTGRADQVFEDRLNHASLLDGALLSRAWLRRYAHGDPRALAAMLEERVAKAPLPPGECRKSPSPAGRGVGERGSKGGEGIKGRRSVPFATPSPGEGLGKGGGKGVRLIATDGVFSMDGDLAPLPELASLAQDADAWLLVDDAHGLGVLGEEGRGSLAHWGLGPEQVSILVGTLGKALGTAGAFVAGSRELIEILIQRARSYIYTTAPPPAIAVATRESLRIARRESWRRERLQTLIQRFRVGAAQLGLPLMESATPIQPLIAGTSRQALSWSGKLEAHGILVSAIRPPTVPEGSARLRITFSAAHTTEDVDRLLEALGGVMNDE